MTTPRLSPEDVAELMRLEQAMWQAQTRFDPAFQARYFAPDFVEFGRSGKIYDRTLTLAQPARPIDCQLPLPHLAVRAIDVATALVTYDSVVRGPRSIEHTHRASLWTRGPQGWALRFHQATPYAPPLKPA
jgi:hypothetical protein